MSKGDAMEQPIVGTGRLRTTTEDLQARIQRVAESITQQVARASGGEVAFFFDDIVNVVGDAVEFVVGGAEDVVNAVVDVATEVANVADVAVDVVQNVVDVAEDAVNAVNNVACLAADIADIFGGAIGIAPEAASQAPSRAGLTGASAAQLVRERRAEISRMRRIKQENIRTRRSALRNKVMTLVRTARARSRS
jgi:phage-related protein